MAFSFGFYNSFNHDRKYNAIQLSMIFDGLISDGMYATVGEAMIVKATEEDNVVVVAPGRGWFNHTWNYNDADLPVNAPISDILLKRIDALVIDINGNEEYRENKIMWVQGTPSSNPIRPVMINALEHHQYPLCYVERNPNEERIFQENITNMVGSSECPFVTGILKTIDIDQLLMQWKDQWAEFVKRYEESAEIWEEEQKRDILHFTNEFKEEMNSFQIAAGEDFSEWFSSLKTFLDDNVATKLQNEIEELDKLSFNRYYGLINSQTKIDNSRNRIVTTTSEAIVTTDIIEQNEITTITSLVDPSEGVWNYEKVTTIQNVAGIDVINSTYNRKQKK